MSWSLIDKDGNPRDDFEVIDGRLVTDQTVATNMVLALENQAGQWWFAPDHGSRFARLRQGESTEADQAGDLETAAREALAPLERDARIGQVTVSVQVSEGRALIDIEAFDLQTGAPVRLKVTPP